MDRFSRNRGGRSTLPRRTPPPRPQTPLAVWQGTVWPACLHPPHPQPSGSTPSSCLAPQPRPGMACGTLDSGSFYIISQSYVVGGWGFLIAPSPPQLPPTVRLRRGTDPPRTDTRPPSPALPRALQLVSGWLMLARLPDARLWGQPSHRGLDPILPFTSGVNLSWSFPCCPTLVPSVPQTSRVLVKDSSLHK